MVTDRSLFDAGMLIGALLRDDPRHQEARPLVEAARRGEISACVTVGILSEVYAALTWARAQPPHSPDEAAGAVRALIQAPSRIHVLQEDAVVALRMLEIASAHRLTARRIHDARHAAAALSAGVVSVYTYDVDDWRRFEPQGLVITGPPSSLLRLPDRPRS